MKYNRKKVLNWLFVVMLVCGISSSDSVWAATISGTVMDDAVVSPGPIANIPVYIFNAVTGNFEDAYDMTDDTGVYSVHDRLSGPPLSAGEYVAQAYGANTGKCSNGIDECGYVSQYSDNIIVTAGEVRSGVDFALELGGAIEGTVLSDCDIGSGVGIEGLSVYTYTDNHAWVDVTYTDANGNFHQGGLKGGKLYKVEILTYGTNYVSQFYNGEFLVIAGQLTNIGAICLESGGSIGGVVTDDNINTPAPISGVSVTAYNKSGRYAGNNYTASDGSYTIQGLNTGEAYWVEANAYGTPYISEYYPDMVTLTALVPDVPNINFSLKIGCSISGRVIDGGNNPVYGINVAAYHAYSMAWVNDASTDAAGNFIIQGLPTDGRVYRIEADTYGTNYIREYYQGAFIFENAALVNCGDTNRDIQIEEGQGISGLVTAGGVGVAGITVSAYEYDLLWTRREDERKYNFYKSAMTASDGSYNIGGLWPGRQYIIEADPSGTDYVGLYYDDVIDADAATLLTVPEATGITNVDFALTPGDSISGVVDSGGVGVPGLTVRAYLETTIDTWDRPNFVYITAAETQGDGSYSLDGLPTATYTPYTNYVIECDPYGYPYIGEIYNEASSLYSGERVLPGSTGINFDLAVGGSISGTVTESNGLEVPGIVMLAYKVSGLDFEGGLIYSYASAGLTAGNGAYIINGLPTDTYIVEAATYGTFYLPEFYDAQHNPDTATWISVTQESETPDIDFVLDRSAVIIGKVSAPGAGPAPNAIITAKATGSDKPSAQVRNDLDGSYALAHLPSGSYTIRAEAAGYAPVSYSPVEVVLGEETVLDIELKPDDNNNGLPDQWELENNDCLSSFAVDEVAEGDGDADGLSNREEYELGTDPCLTDTDGDGIPDNWEVAYGLDPLNSGDAGADVLTDDFGADADRDGYSNGFEYEQGCDPLKPPTIIYVDTDLGDDIGGDGGQGNPYKSIPAALEAACVGDSVRVLTGGYALSEVLWLKAGVKLIGVSPQEVTIDLANFSMRAADYSTLSGFSIINPAAAGGIICDNAAAVEISNNIILGASGTGILLTGSSAEITNNSLLYLNTAVKLANGSAPVIYNNIIAHNTTDIQTDGSDAAIVDYNNLWDNLNSILLGANDIALDPLFVDQANSNYHLKINSACRNSGNPAESYNNRDGTQNDIGADGGPRGALDENVPAVQIIGPDSAAIAEEVSFVGSASDEWGINTYAWDFGDGSGVVVEQNPQHTYTACGRYLVTLTAGDHSGLEATGLWSITVGGPQVGDPPTVTIEADQVAGAAPLMVSFNGQADYGNNWSWDFDASDGIDVDSSLQAPVHEYSLPGVYVATLTVYGRGCRATTTIPITVLEPASQLTAWQQIGPGGGNIPPADGVSLGVPPDTLSQPAVLALAHSFVTPGLPAGTKTMGSVLDVGPSGLGFSQPVTLGLPYDAALLQSIIGSADPYMLQVYTCDEFISSCNSGLGWQETALSSADQDSVFVKVNHFSLYTLAVSGEPPTAPNNLTITPLTATGLRLDWWDNSDNEEGFKVYRNGNLLTSLANSELTSFRDSGLALGTIYSYTVRAYNRFGTSDKTNVATFTTNDPAIVDDTGDGAVNAVVGAVAGEDTGGAGGGFCFIATAAYGTPLAVQVRILSRFRDRYLLPNEFGHKFVELYYRYSPPAARYIADRPYLKALVRISLLPLIGFSWLMLAADVWQKLAMVLFMLVMGGGWLVAEFRTRSS